MNNDKQKELKESKCNDSWEDNNYIDLIKGYVWQEYDNFSDKYETVKIELRLPKKIQNKDTKKKQTAWVQVYSYDWNNQKNNTEINEKLKKLKRNDLIAVKGKWRFYASNKYPLMLNFNATDIKILKKAETNIPKNNLQSKKQSHNKETKEIPPKDLSSENIINESKNE